MRKKGIRRIIASAAAIGLVLSLCACSGSGNAPAGLEKMGAVTAMTREADSGTRGTFDDLTGIVSEGSGLTAAGSTEEVLQKVAGDENAIGYLTQDAADKSVKVLKVEGKSIDDKDYPMTRKLYLVNKGSLNDLEKEFVTYVTGKGQEIVEKEFEPVGKSKMFLSLKPKGTIRIAGSSSEAPVMEKLAKAYMAINPNAKVTVETSDSGTGINDALEGKCDLGMSSRSPKSYEQNLLTFAPVAKDRIAVIVPASSPLEDITLDQLKAIYTGKVTKWPDLFDQQ